MIPLSDSETMNCHSSDVQEDIHQKFIRRSRGYTPEPYKINYDVNDLNVLALGPELDVTFSIAKDDIVYPSQHIGNTNKPKTLEFLKEAIENMQRITKISEFDAIACDMHPHFFTTRLAYQLAEELLLMTVQLMK